MSDRRNELEYRQHDLLVEEYLPELHYILNLQEDSLRYFIVETSMYIYDMGDSYEIGSILKVEGLIREKIDHSQAEIRDYFREAVVDILGKVLTCNFATISVFRNDNPILHQPHGFPGNIYMNHDEFSKLTNHWISLGFPHNMYFHHSERINVIEPQAIYGGIVRVARSYTPLQWRKRSETFVEKLLIPTEEERRSHFLAASNEYLRVLALRLREVLEPEQPEQPEVAERIALLARDLRALMSNTMAKNESKENPA